MLTENQKGYLLTVPEDRMAKVMPFDPKTQVAANGIISEIQAKLPLAEVIYLGSSKLGIAGENDIDLTVIINGDFKVYFNALKELFGVPLKEQLDNKLTKWEFSRNDFPVELHLMDKPNSVFQEQIDSQNILENNADLRLGYERIKLASNGLPYREYLKRKYEFWNNILGLK